MVGWNKFIIKSHTGSVQARIINPGTARRRSLSLCAIPSALRNNFLWHRRRSKSVLGVCPVANLRVCISQPLRWCRNIKLFTCASHSRVALLLQTHTEFAFCWRRKRPWLQPSAARRRINFPCAPKTNLCPVKLVYSPGFSCAPFDLEYSAVRARCSLARNQIRRKPNKI